MRRHITVTLIGLASIGLGLAVWMTGRAIGAPGVEAQAGDALDDGDRTISSMSSYGKYARLSFCVQTLDATPTDARYARQQIRAALQAFVGVRPYPDGNLRPFVLPPLIDVGCPTEPALLRPDRRGTRVAWQPTDPLPAPSRYHRHVFVATPETLARIRPGATQPWRLTTAEEYWTDSPTSGTQSQVTEGIYVSVAELGDLTEVEAILAQKPWSLRRAGEPPGPAPALGRPGPRPWRVGEPTPTSSTP